MFAGLLAVLALAFAAAPAMAADGTGTMAVSPSNVVSDSTGNTLTFTYTADGAVTSGELTIDLPDGWSPPSTTIGNPGYTTASCGIVGASGMTIEVTLVNLTNTGTCTITYGDTSGGPGVTAPAEGGYLPYTFTADEKSTSTGSLKQLSFPPVVYVTAPDGSGAMAVSPDSLVSGSTGDYETFTYTAPEGGLNGGDLALLIPSGWTPPDGSTITNPGGLGGTCGEFGYSVTSVAGGYEVQAIDIELLVGQTCTIEYGIPGTNSGVTAPSTAGVYSFTSEESSTAGGTLTTLSSSPTVTVGTNGTGTMAVNPQTVVAGSTGNTLAFQYTAGGTVTGGELTLTPPTGWPAPSQTATAQGYSTASCGTLSISGGEIIVTGINLARGSTCTITYGSRSGAGPGVTAPSTGGGDAPYLFAAQEGSSVDGALTTLASGPAAVFVVAADGTGTLTVNPNSVLNGSPGNQLTFTYTAAAGGLDNGTITIAAPSGWTQPQTATSSAAGYVVSGCGTGVGVSGMTIELTGVTLDGGQTCQVVYGDTSDGQGATAPTSSGPSTFATQEESTDSGTLTSIGTSPSVVVSDDGAGSLTVSPLVASAAGPGNTLTFTYQATVVMTDGEVTVQAPSGWSQPSTAPGDPGYTTSTCGTVGVNGMTIEVTGVTLAVSGQCTITYGSTASSGPGATAASTPGTSTFDGEEESSTDGTLSTLAFAPQVAVYAADGAGTTTVTPSFLASGAEGNTLTFTYAAGAGGLAGGEVELAVPSGWSAPSITGTDPGYTTSNCGTVAVDGQTIELQGVTLSAGATCTVAYGDTSDGGPGATVPAASGLSTFAVEDVSTPEGVPAAIANSPGVDVGAGDGSGTVTASPTVVGAGTTGNTVGFSYVAAAGGTHGGEILLTVPAGWSTPTTSSFDAGSTTADCGAVHISGMTIEVTSVTLKGGATCTIIYGSTGAGGPGAAAPSADGTSTFATSEMSTATGTLTALAASPSITTEGFDTLTVSVSGSGQVSGDGISCPGTCTDSYAPGTVVSLTETPAGGSSFKGWGGDCGGSGGCQVTVAANESVSAAFATTPGGGQKPPPPQTECVVPKLKGDSLVEAKRMLGGAHCALGKVTSPKAKQGHRLRVKLVVSSTRPGQGARLAAGTKIALKLGAAPKKHKHRRKRHGRHGKR